MSVPASLFAKLCRRFEELPVAAQADDVMAILRLDHDKRFARALEGVFAQDLWTHRAAAAARVGDHVAVAHDGNIDDSMSARNKEYAQSTIS